MFRPVGAQEEDPGAHDRLGHPLQKGAAGVVDPLQVLDHQDRRLVTAAGLDAPGGHLEQPAPAGLGIRRGQRPIRGGNAEELEQQWQVGGERRIEGQHR